MHSAAHCDLMQARHHDLMRSAAQQRLAAQVKASKPHTARRAHRDDAATAPGRALRLIWRLLPA